jgi:hypothetical protein
VLLALVQEEKKKEGEGADTARALQKRKRRRVSDCEMEAKTAAHSKHAF